MLSPEGDMQITLEAHDTDGYLSKFENIEVVHVMRIRPGRGCVSVVLPNIVRLGTNDENIPFKWFYTSDVTYLE